MSKINKTTATVSPDTSLFVINSAPKKLNDKSIEFEIGDYNSFHQRMSNLESKADLLANNKKHISKNLLSLRINRTKLPSFFMDESKDQADKILEPSIIRLYKDAHVNINNPVSQRKSADVFYKLLKRSKIKEKLINADLTQQSETLLKNIKLNFTKKKPAIRKLEIPKVNINISKQQKGSLSGSFLADSMFLTNIKAQKRYSKRTTIGGSIVISHPVRASECPPQGDPKVAAKIANEFTIKNNNSIKVLCFKSNTEFAFKDVNPYDICKDIHKSSYYSSLYKRVTVDNSYKRIQKLQSMVKSCIISPSNNIEILPKIK
jgi:hypothetical protein